MKQHKHKYENVIIGGSLEALEFAYSSGYPLLCIPQKPHFFRPNSLAKWEDLAFKMSLSGQLPIADGLTTIRIDSEEKEIKCFTDNSRVINFSYETAYIIDDHGIDGLPLPIKEAKKEYLVLDWINVKRGGKHPFEFLTDTDSDFVRKLMFYPSERIMGKRDTVKDACAISVMTDKQLRNNEYSESYAMLKSREMMKEAGIKGSRNGTQAYNGKPAYLSIKVEIGHRDTYPLHKNEYEDTDSLKFSTLDKNTPRSYNGYLEYHLGKEYGEGEPRGSTDSSREEEI